MPIRRCEIQSMNERELLLLHRDALPLEIVVQAPRRVLGQGVLHEACLLVRDLLVNAKLDSQKRAQHAMAAPDLGGVRLALLGELHATVSGLGRRSRRP